MPIPTYRITPDTAGTWALACERETGRCELVQAFPNKEAAIAWSMAHVESRAPCRLEVIRRDGAIAFRRSY